jgi:polyisoprenoid-binding protein YceI
MPELSLRILGGLSTSRAAAALALVAVCTPLQARAEPVVFAVDPKTSHVRIHLGRSGLFQFMGHEHHIEAPVTEGRVEATDGDPARSSVSLRFASAALHVIPGSEPADDIPKVEERMRGPEVLEVSRYPEIVFASSSVRGSEGTGARLKLTVAGTLSLKGRSFPIEIPLQVEIHGESLTAKGEAELKLRDLGIEPPSVGGVVNVSNRFKLELEVHARRAP